MRSPEGKHRDHRGHREGQDPSSVSSVASVLILLAVASATFVPAASAKTIDAVLAEPVEPGTVVERPLEMAFLDLEADHPAVARAVEDAGRMVIVSTEEQASTARFFVLMQDHDALRTRGVDHRVEPQYWTDDTGTQSLPEAPLPAALAAGALAVAAALARRARR